MTAKKDDAAAAAAFTSSLDAALATRRQKDDNDSIDIADLYKLKLRPPQGFLAGNILCPKSVALVAGEEGTGKTFLMLWLAACVASGERFGPFETRRASVLFLSEEMLAEEMLDRVHRLFSPADVREMEGRLRFRFRTGVRFDSERGLLFLRRMLEADREPGLVIVDALSDVHTSDENSNRDMGRIMADVREIATDTNACIAIIHHFAKPSEARTGANRVRGASDLKAKAADMISIERPAKERDRRPRAGAKDAGTASAPAAYWRTVKFAKVRHGAIPDPFRFQLVEDEANGRVRVAFDSPVAFASTRVRELVGLIRKGGGRLSRAQLLTLAEKRLGWAPRVTEKWIRAARQLGAVAIRSTTFPATFEPTS